MGIGQVESWLDFSEVLISVTVVFWFPKVGVGYVDLSVESNYWTRKWVCRNGT